MKMKEFGPPGASLAPPRIRQWFSSKSVKNADTFMKQFIERYGGDVLQVL